MYFIHWFTLCIIYAQEDEELPWATAFTAFEWTIFPKSSTNIQVGSLYCSGHLLTTVPAVPNKWENRQKVGKNGPKMAKIAELARIGNKIINTYHYNAQR